MSELYHYGILGMKWGVRRYQNPDGSLTSAGRKRYLKSTENGDVFWPHDHSHTHRQREKAKIIEESYKNKILSDVKKTEILDENGHELSKKITNLKHMTNIYYNYDTSKELLEAKKLFQSAVEKNGDVSASDTNKIFKTAENNYYKKYGYKSADDFNKKRKEAAIDTGKTFYKKVSTNELLKQYNSVDINDALGSLSDGYKIDDYLETLWDLDGGVFEKPKV